MFECDVHLCEHIWLNRLSDIMITDEQKATLCDTNTKHVD